MGTELMGPAQLLQAQLAHSLATADVALDGLTQEEFDWEPVPGAWSVRPRSDGRRGWGAGEIVCEDAWPPPDPLPLTTIGWRVVHLAAWTRIYTDHLFGDGTASLDNVEIPSGADACVAWLRAEQAKLQVGVDQLTDAGCAEPRPAHWGELLPAAQLVTIMLAEHVHHLAEVALLRDLQRGRALSQAPPPLPPGGSRWTAE